MRLKLEELQKVVEKTIREERTHLSLREELYKMLGPSILVSERIERVAQVANEQMDVFEATGREFRSGGMKLSVLVEAAGSSSQHVRKVAARLLPVKMVSNLLFDPSSSVRCAAASRLPYSLVKESVRRFPGDDQLRTIARSKKLEEAGLPKPTTVDEPFDMYGDEPMGDAAKSPSPMKGMSDMWYEMLAHKLCAEYGSNLEGQWEETLSTRFASSYFATSGVKLDRDKLLKAIYACIEERDESVMGEGSLRRIASRLREDSCLSEAAMPIISEEPDPVTKLLEMNGSSTQYITEAEMLFGIRKSYLPRGIKKYSLGEGKSQETQVPVKGSLPLGGLTSRVEEALDRYVDAWNKRQSLAGEPYVLSWYPHPASSDSIGFNLELK